MLFDIKKLFWGVLPLMLDFGGGGGGGGSTTATTTNVLYSPEESAKRVELFNTAKALYDATKSGYGPGTYPGTAPVGFSDYTKQARQALVDALPQAQNTLANYNSALNFGLSGMLDVGNNPYVRGMADAATKNIERSYTDPGGAMSAIRTGAVENGQFGGSRQGIAEGVAKSRESQDIGSAVADIYGKSYLTGMQGFNNALNQTPANIAAQLTPATWLSGLGLQDETLQQQMNDFLTSQKLWNIGSDWTPFQNYANVVMGLGPSQTAATSVGPAAQTNPASSLLGLGSFAAGAYPYVSSLFGAGAAGAGAAGLASAAIPASTTAAIAAGNAANLDWLGSLLFV